MDGAWLGSVDIAMKKVEIPMKISMNILLPQAKTAVFFQMDTDIIGSLSQVLGEWWWSRCPPSPSLEEVSSTSSTQTRG